MRAAVLVVLCGCGFHIGAQSGTDAAAGDDDDGAPVPTIDGWLDTFDAPAVSPDSPLPTLDAADPTWTVIETLNVPVANGAQVTSTMSLAVGVTYHLRVSGSYVTDTSVNLLADAEYYDYAVPKDVTPIGTPVDVGVGIDDATSDGSKQPSWGPYTTTHIYEISFVGKGARIKANIHDGNYANDSGSLTLEILSLQ